MSEANGAYGRHQQGCRTHGGAVLSSTMTGNWLPSPMSTVCPGLSNTPRPPREVTSTTAAIRLPTSGVIAAAAWLSEIRAVSAMVAGRCGGRGLAQRYDDAPAAARRGGSRRTATALDHGERDAGRGRSGDRPLGRNRAGPNTRLDRPEGGGSDGRGALAAANAAPTSAPTTTMSMTPATTAIGMSGACTAMNGIPRGSTCITRRRCSICLRLKSSATSR